MLPVLLIVLAQPAPTPGKVQRAGTGLQLSGGTVSCKLAATGVVGCLNGIAGQSQTADAYMRWSGLATFLDSYVSSTWMSVPVSLRAGDLGGGGIAVTSIVPQPQGSLNLYGRRVWGDDAPDVVIYPELWRDGGYLFGVTQPREGGAHNLVWGVDESGNVHLMNAIDRNGMSDVGGATIYDDTTASGHYALKRRAGYYLSAAGGLGASADYSGAFCLVQDDGGRPHHDGGSWTYLQADGGACFAYAGEHGDTAVGAGYGMTAGFILELYNPTSGAGLRTDHKAFFNWAGAYSQNHGLDYAHFPTPQPVTVQSMLGFGGATGTIYFGSLPGTLMWSGVLGDAVSTGSQRWYWSEPLADGGAQWAKVEHAHAEPWVPVVTSSTTPTDGTTLGKSCFDSAEQRAVPSLHLTISSAASGASSNLTIRGTNAAGNTCDVAFACNTAAGTYVKTASGNGCSLTWSDCVTWVAQSKGGCSTWPTFTGITPLTTVQ